MTTSKMTTTPRPPANSVVRSLRRIYNPIGFTKGYNFTLWFIFGGALLGFALARAPYLSLHGVLCSDSAGPILGAAPGECWYYLHGARHETIGIVLHLAGVIPASILAFFQFIPVIRHKFLLVHRVNGYLVMLLSLVGVAGALMITRHAFGGGLDTQVGSGLLGVAFVASMAMAYVNIKRLQIEQHRAWMLRGWFYVSSCFSPTKPAAALVFPGQILGMFGRRLTTMSLPSP
ncbi:DUF2306 domain-containing protein [Candidatus Bathyarchaeota archaeon]|nr:DUF2306 domain-containing protein [Candidatus Bathyarchaeota archaeon]